MPGTWVAGGGVWERKGLGDILRRHRERLWLLQGELVEAAGGNLSVKTIGNIERGQSRPYRHTLEPHRAAPANRALGSSMSTTRPGTASVRTVQRRTC